MRHHLTRLAVGLITFSVGVCVATLLVSSPRPVAVAIPAPVIEKQKAELQAPPTNAEICARLWAREDIIDEAKAIAAAQGFISRMGYTDGIARSADMMADCVEVSDDLEESYGSRYDTLEPRAYGLSHSGRRGESGWTVVFRYTKRAGGSRMKTGRAVTMDEHFRNLRVEHRDFFLDKVEEKWPRFVE